jgi:hypothetical protein
MSETFEQKLVRLANERDDRMYARFDGGRGEFVDHPGWCVSCGRQTPFGSCLACDDQDRDREKVGTGQEMDL